MSNSIIDLSFGTKGTTTAKISLKSKIIKKRVYN